MQMSDVIADMLTRIRNASDAKHESVEIPASNMKKAIADILANEGYIKGYQIIEHIVRRASQRVAERKRRPRRHIFGKFGEQRHDSVFGHNTPSHTRTPRITTPVELRRYFDDIMIRDGERYVNAPRPLLRPKGHKKPQTLETAGIKHLSCVISLYESCFTCKHWQTGNTKSAQPRSASPSRTRAERSRRLLQTQKIVGAHIEILRQFEDSRSRRLLLARFPITDAGI